MNNSIDASLGEQMQFFFRPCALITLAILAIQTSGCDNTASSGDLTPSTSTTHLKSNIEIRGFFVLESGDRIPLTGEEVLVVPNGLPRGAATNAKSSLSKLVARVRAAKPNSTFKCSKLDEIESRVNDLCDNIEKQAAEKSQAVLSTQKFVFGFRDIYTNLVRHADANIAEKGDDGFNCLYSIKEVQDYFLEIAESSFQHAATQRVILNASGEKSIQLESGSYIFVWISRSLRGKVFWYRELVVAGPADFTIMSNEAAWVR